MIKIVDEPKLGANVALHYRGELKLEGVIESVSQNGYTMKTSTGKILYRRGNTWRCHGWTLAYQE